MKKLHLLVLLNILFSHLQAQEFTWAKVEGKFAYDYGYGVSTDNDGNVYLAGKYEEEAVFSGTTLPCQGNHDIFVARYTPAGTLTWIKTAGGSLGDYAHSLACNKTGNVYIAGEIEGAGIPVTFQGTSTTLITKGDNDIFVASYDLNGNLMWAKSEGTFRSEKALGVSYDDAGNVIICGYFTDTTNFAGTVVPGNGGHDMFIAKYDKDGHFMWERHAGGPERDEALAIKCDPAGNIYVCGMHSDGAVFGGTTLTTVNTPTGHYLNAFIAKYAPDGTMIWVKSSGGDYDDVAWSITMDNAGKIFVAGEFNAYATFDGTGITTTGQADIFVASYNNSGSLNWVSQAGGPLIDRARGIGTDGNNIFITGQFGNTANFGSYSVTAADSSDIFIAQLNNSGTFEWATSVSGAPDTYENLGYESGNSICAESGTAYVTGSLLNGGMFGTNALSGIDRTDVFLTKMTTYVGIKELSKDNSIQIFPNPGTGIFNIQSDPGFAKKTDISVYNYLGEKVYQTTPTSSKILMDLSEKQKGIYMVEISSGKKISTQKIVLQ
jgi:hypothetical protein